MFVVPAMKLVPVMVMVVLGEPAAIVLGLIEEIAGPFTVNALAVDEEVLVFLTVTFSDPEAASCALVTAAVSEVALP